MNLLEKQIQVSLILWSPGPLVLWSPGPLVSWSRGPLLPWSSGPFVPWSLGPLDPLVPYSPHPGPLPFSSFDLPNAP